MQGFPRARSRGGAGLTGQQVWLAVFLHQQNELQHELRRAAQEGLQ